MGEKSEKFCCFNFTASKDEADKNAMRKVEEILKNKKRQEETKTKNLNPEEYGLRSLDVTDSSYRISKSRVKRSMMKRLGNGKSG